MKNLRFPAIVLTALAAGFVLLLATSAHSLPLRVASHFDGAGHANGWTNRATLIGLMATAGLAIPILFTVIFGATLLFGRRRHILLATERGITVPYLLRRSIWFGSLTLCFVAAVQALIIDANNSTPPRLQMFPLSVVLASFTVGVAFWSFSLLYHFSRSRRPSPPAENQPAV